VGVRWPISVGFQCCGPPLKAVTRRAVACCPWLILTGSVRYDDEADDTTNAPAIPGAVDPGEDRGLDLLAPYRELLFGQPHRCLPVDHTVRGATNRQTALDMFISVKTVQYHLTHIYAKLGIRSRSELAARFRETQPQDD